MFIDKVLVSAAEYLCILIHSSKSYGSSIPISVKGSSSVDPSVHRALICYPAVVVFLQVCGMLVIALALSDQRASWRLIGVILDICFSFLLWP